MSVSRYALLAVVLGVLVNCAAPAGQEEGTAPSVQAGVIGIEGKKSPCISISGTWDQAGDGTFSPRGHNPNAFTLVGGTNWHGYLSGTTTYTYKGIYSPETDQYIAHGPETFTGSDVTGRSGTIEFKDHALQDATTFDTVVDCKMKGGTGDFAGAKGRLVFVGSAVDESGALAGTYSGTLCL